MGKFLECLLVEISEDKSSASMSFERKEGVPPDAQLVIEDVLNELKNNYKLAFINEEAVAATLEKFNETGEEFSHVEIANSGKPMKKGVDGYLEWTIEREPHLEEDSHGKVDFYAFSVLKNVGKGQMVAVLHDPVPGEDGVSVRGEPIPAIPVKAVTYQAGQGIEYEADEKKFYATVSGRIEVRGTSILCLRFFEVSGDVDFSIGNIKFDGIVRVTGSVGDNFIVSATEGVQVDGSVEAAQVESGGTVVVMGGINCRGRGHIKAESEIRTRFLNNATVYCKGPVAIENEILNCTMYVDSVVAPAGGVAGGELVAKTSIDIKEAGSPMGVRTVLHAGKDYFLEGEVSRLEEQLEGLSGLIQELNKRLRVVEGVLNRISDDKKKGYQDLKERLTQLQKNEESLKVDIEARKRKVYSNDAKVIIRGEVHPGVVIRIGRYEKSLTQKFEGYRRYMFDKNKYDIVAFFDEPQA